MDVDCNDCGICCFSPINQMLLFFDLTPLGSLAFPLF